MGTKDTVAKKFWSDNAKFADLINANVFDGRQVVHPEDLQPEDPVELAVLSKLEKLTTSQKVRDILRSCQIRRGKGSYFVLIGIENQSDIHYAMPVRNMLYDALNYLAQVDAKAKEHKLAKDSLTQGEYLSGFAKGDRIIPVVTLTVYWGADAWDGPRRLSDMYADVDPEIVRMAGDYEINLISPAEVKDFAKYSTELGELLELIKHSDDQEEMIRFLSGKGDGWELDRDSLIMANEFADTRFSVEQGGERVRVARAFAQQAEESHAKGVYDTLYHLVEKNKISVSEAAEEAGVSEDVFTANMLASGYKIPDMQLTT